MLRELFIIEKFQLKKYKEKKVEIILSNFYNFHVFLDIHL